MTKSIGAQITKLREARDMTRYRLAKECGISWSHLNDLESEKFSPKLDLIEKISNVLEVPVAELLEIQQSNDLQEGGTE